VDLKDTHLEMEPQDLKITILENLSGFTGELLERSQLEFLRRTNQVQVLLTQIGKIESHEESGEEASQKALQSLFGGQLDQLCFPEESSENVSEDVIDDDQDGGHQHPDHAFVHVHDDD
jgi:hypothetical protein